MHSSRVGVSTRAWTSRSSGSTYSSIGNPKAAVFPLPVWAWPITSRPSSSGGMPCTWIGLGDSYPTSRRAAISGSDRPRSEKDGIAPAYVLSPAQDHLGHVAALDVDAVVGRRAGRDRAALTEAHDAVVVAHEQVAGGVDVDECRRDQCATADRLQVAPVGGEALDAAVAAVGHEHRPVGPHRDARRLEELAAPPPRAAERGDQPAARAEDHHLVLDVVGDVHEAPGRVDLDPVGRYEFTRAAPEAPEG